MKKNLIGPPSEGTEELERLKDLLQAFEEQNPGLLSKLAVIAEQTNSRLSIYPSSISGSSAASTS